MKTRIQDFSIVLGAVIVIAASAAHAYGQGTRDQQPPAQEQVCDDAGLYGAAYGICIAFCEANDCDSQETPDSKACSALRVNYTKQTGEIFLPCETVWIPQIP
jgi:hypothetical protein